MDELPEAPLDQPEPKYVDCPECDGNGKKYCQFLDWCRVPICKGYNCDEPCPRCEGRGFVPNEEKNDER